MSLSKKITILKCFFLFKENILKSLQKTIFEKHLYFYILLLFIDIHYILTIKHIPTNFSF